MLGVTIGFSLITLVVSLITMAVPAFFSVANTLLIGVLAWWFAVIAFIFSRALDIPSITSFALALAYALLIIVYPSLLLNLFGVPLATP